MSTKQNVPLRLCVPSGKFAGPIEKPFRDFLTSLPFLRDSASCKDLVGAIVS